MYIYLQKPEEGVVVSDIIRKLTCSHRHANSIFIRTDQRATRVSITGGSTSTSGTDHVLSDISGEDALTVGSGVDGDLDPLEMVGQEQSSSRCQTPASAVTHSLCRDLCVSGLEELDGLHVGVFQVQGLLEGDDADVMVKVRSVPTFVVFHSGNGSILVTLFKVSVMCSSHNRIKSSQLALTAVSSCDDLMYYTVTLTLQYPSGQIRMF